MNNYIKKSAKKTKSKIDDRIVNTITKPLRIFIFIIGFDIALKSLSVLIPYSSWIDGIFFVLSLFIVSLIVSKILTVLISSWLTAHKRFRRIPRLIGKIITITIVETIIRGKAMIDRRFPLFFL